MITDLVTKDSNRNESAQFSCHFAIDQVQKYYKESEKVLLEKSYQTN